MRIPFPAAVRPCVRALRLAPIVLGALAFVSVVRVSAHFVRGVGPSGSTSAFVSSPTDGADVPVQVKWGSAAGDTGLRSSASMLQTPRSPASIVPAGRASQELGSNFRLGVGLCSCRPRRCGLAPGGGRDGVIGRARNGDARFRNSR
jgi:hypothetical protein